MASLILTNGDSAADLLAAAGKEGRILPWRDVLHEGPIKLDLAACTKLRADYVARRFLVDPGEVAADFAARDAVLSAHAGFERIELWFEHDLYDQLQILQILAFFAGVQRSDGLILVQADDFLGGQKVETILQFADLARPLDADDLDLGERVFADLAMPTPERAFAHLAEPGGSLPYLAPALRRFFEELPAPQTGLSRTEGTALAGIAEGNSRAVDLFHRAIASEEAPFMGDMSFFRMLDDLAFAETPLIAGLAPPPEREDGTERYRDAVLRLTAAGAAAVNGDADHVALSGLDRWWAGTRLYGRSVWRYDRNSQELVPPDGRGA
jgi:hypothetical protein